MKTTVKHVFELMLLILLGTMTAGAQSTTASDIPYGTTEKAGTYLLLNSAKIYYEEYGKGERLLLIHGNNGSIASMKHQIDYFKSTYRVIIPDNRGQSTSELKTDSLNYDQTIADWEALAQHLKLDTINVIGWSDGCIIGLKMGILGKLNLNKIVAMGANLRPDSTTVHQWAINHDQKTLQMIYSIIKEKDTSQNWAK
jgi:pimeloyl-ACP methyl ester carboxylesterase